MISDQGYISVSLPGSVKRDPVAQMATGLKVVIGRGHQAFNDADTAQPAPVWNS